MDAIGVFDSGVGGLSVGREIARQLPGADLIYLADQAHVPYGPRPMSEIRALATAITRFLLQQGAGLVVVACNTASAAALYHLRTVFPHLPFVGMEPAVKPAAQNSRSGAIGVIATPATFQGELFASLVERFAGDVRVLTQVCPGLVEAVEAGQVEGPATEALLRVCLTPLLEAGIDALVLGCTHYAFLAPAMRRVVGPRVQIVDPAPAVARQVKRVWQAEGRPAPAGKGQRLLYTSAALEPFAAWATRLLDLPGPWQVRQALWRPSPEGVLQLLNAPAG